MLLKTCFPAILLALAPAVADAWSMDVHQQSPSSLLLHALVHADLKNFAVGVSSLGLSPPFPPSSEV